jgi:hypothetical protein
MTRFLTSIEHWDKQADVLARAFLRLIGKARPGKVAFVRDAPPDVIRRLACDLRFQQILKAQHWQVYGVADREDKYDNTITSDQAVALREKKGPALLLLVDRQKAGPGMDGVYSACLEIKEEKLFERACDEAVQSVESTTYRKWLRRLLKETSQRQQHRSPWFRFDFLARSAEDPHAWGKSLWLLGLWPVVGFPIHSKTDEQRALACLEESARLVAEVLDVRDPLLSIAERLARAQVRTKTEADALALQQFLETKRHETTEELLRALSEHPHFWLGAIELASAATSLSAIELSPWRTKHGTAPFKWSGLIADEERKG